MGEDIGGQVKSSLQWINGLAPYPNMLQEPSAADLSRDISSWSLRPIGAALLPYTRNANRFKLGNSIKLGVFLCLILGGCGWIRFFQKKKFIILILFSFLLCLAASVEFLTNYATANVILYAITPFFILWVLRISDLSVQASPNLKLYSAIAFLLFSLGFFSWIKLSGIIVAGTIGAYLFFFMAFGKDKQNKIKFIFIFIFLGIGFWVPFFFLNW